MPSNGSLSFIYKHVLNALILVTVHIWGFFESVLFVGGFIVCIMLPVVWPMKLIYAVLWLIVFCICSKVVSFLEKHLDRNNNRE